MQNLWFIGGTSRVGKSYLCRQLEKLQPQAVPLLADPIIQSLKINNIISDVKFASWSANATLTDWVEALLLRDEEAGPIVLSMIENLLLTQNRDVIYEGVTIWPETLNKKNFISTVKQNIIYIVDTRSSHEQVSWLESMQTGSEYNSWQKNWSFEDINNWVPYNTYRSHKIKEQAKFLKYTCFDVKDYENLTSLQENVLQNFQLV